ncbi:MAG: glutamate synthase subunit beta [Burkholderiaceae bacterium]|nr:glutamate synthase subunit beta [Burkholderiaceae bacterium]
MGKITGFMEYQRQAEMHLSPQERVKNYKEFVFRLEDKEAQIQGARCMNCGVPFCNNGCPVNNIIPDWNDLVYHDKVRAALDVLHSTNNFPEFTGRVCPAPCEAACTLNINSDPVGIKSIEHYIIDKAWENGWVVPQPAPVKTGKKVAVVGSGPAGLAAAQQLARAGHDVTVFEKNDRAGGLLRYGIPDFKLEKDLIDRRIKQMEAEGVVFRTGVLIGKDFPERIANYSKETISPETLRAEFDAVILAGGAEQARDLPVPGRELDGVHFAMEFLHQQNKVNAGDKLKKQITATGKHVVVIGGGDTGSDCVGISHRQGAASIIQIEVNPHPPVVEDKPLVWPYWPKKLRTSTSLEEGGEREWAVASKRFEGKSGKVTKLIASRVKWENGKFDEIPDSEMELKADLVLIAIGFASPVGSVLEAFGVERDARGNARAATDGDGSYQTSVEKVFAAGDMRRGQSLIVWAIREGRQCARAVDEYLMGGSQLPR